jgi:hypothetical protein
MSDPVKIILNREVFPQAVCEGRVGNVLVIENDPLPSLPEPPVKTYGNAEKSVQLQRNDCGSGKSGTTVTYTVPAGKYTSEVSQEDADALAQADLDKNAQSYANLHGTCELKAAYENAELVRKVYKSDCPVKGNSGTAVNYIVPAGKYSSWISQGDADAKAEADARDNAQAYADLNGSCAIKQPAVKLYVNAPDGCDKYFVYYMWTNPTSGKVMSLTGKQYTYQSSELPAYIFSSTGTYSYAAFIQLMFPETFSAKYRVKVSFPEGSTSVDLVREGKWHDIFKWNNGMWGIDFWLEVHSEVTLEIEKR